MHQVYAQEPSDNLRTESIVRWPYSRAMQSWYQEMPIPPARTELPIQSMRMLGAQRQMSQSQSRSFWWNLYAGPNTHDVAYVVKVRDIY